MDKIIVTGGLGMIGPFVCRALLSTGLQPIIYDASSDTSLAADIAVDCVIESGNVCDLPRLMDVVSAHQPQAIVHFAGQTGPRVEQFPWASLQTNLMGTATVFECARLSGIQRVIFPSSKMAYGPVAEKHRHPTYEPVTEQHPLEPEKHYGKLKRTCEGLADHYAKLYGLDIIAFRFASVFGPGRPGKPARLNPVIAFIESAIAGQPYSIGFGADQRDHFCYYGEAGNAVIAALKSTPRPGAFRAYNIASGDTISLAEIVAVLKQLYPAWRGEAGPGLDYRRYGVGYYYPMATEKARAEIGFTAKFDFRHAVIDFAETACRVRK